MNKEELAKLTKNEIATMIKGMEEGKSLYLGDITITKKLDFTELHGIGKGVLEYRYYKWVLESGFGDFDDGDFGDYISNYETIFYSCHNDSDIEDCINTIFRGEII